MKVERKFDGVYFLADERAFLATENLKPGESVYGERIERVGGKEYREWDPHRSKPSAAIQKGCRAFPFARGSKVLYLGAGSGTTASHISDIVGDEGKVFCVDVAYRPMRDFLERVAKKRENVVAILSDARHPLLYRWMVEECDVAYCDVAQQDQTKIMLDNCELYLKPGGHAVIAVKARSISSVARPEETYREEARKIRDAGYEIVEQVDLEPYAEAHRMITSVRKGRR
ncbi:MAG: fibrillarin-like rRNA/tRNA 2'-O-methyltransferase [Candidatus Brockarchaeota archaeon]|nr:fibrillarin-like rRNA/tRNA 2'-O-methyltransferase [Candidatus Brockarchaeota archaeon]